MLKVYYKDNFKYISEDKDLTKEYRLKIEINGNTLTCYLDLYLGDNEEAVVTENYDTVELQSYHSYALITKGVQTLTKRGRTVHISTCEFVDLNRLGTATKDDYFKTLNNFSYNLVAQVDTGIVTDGQQDVVINVIKVPQENISFAEGVSYDIAPASSLNGKYVREDLWDNYSVTVNNKEFKYDRWGIAHDENSTDITCEDSKDYIEFTIKKYKGYFTDTLLNRDIDNEEVFIETSAGLCNPRRLKLVNGTAVFRIYPFGYTGYIKIKLGRKWYTVWNDYELNIV